MDRNPLDHLRTLIEDAKKSNCLQQNFFVHDGLRQAISPTLIADVLDRAVPRIPKHHIARASELIAKDALLVFCVLVVINQVELIAEFQAHAIADSRLPIRAKEELQPIASELDTDAFIKMQWQFVPWSFKEDALHVILPDETIIPFLHTKFIAKGDGGSISEVVLPNSLQSIWAPSDKEAGSVTVVRKVINPTKSGRGTKVFNNERECLELYRTREPQNILSLLASYTIGGEHAMLFPFFPMDLETFLASETRFGCFGDDSTFIAAIAALASALRTVHEANQRCKFTPTLRTQYGYHHDIRPANILVTPTTFIFADFGLSRHTPPGEEPSRVFIKNIGHYLAPESMDQKMNPQQVGRACDVWALGCLVSELATYLERGPAGVKQFRAQRMSPNYYSIPLQNGYFFDGAPPVLRRQVSEWLASLSENPQHQIVSKLAAFCRNALQPDPASRPSSEACFLQLCYVHASHLYETASSLLQEALSSNSSSSAVPESAITEGYLELSRLQAFGEVMGMNNNQALQSSLFRNTALATLVVERLSTICYRLGICKSTWMDLKKQAIESKACSPLGSAHLVDIKLVDAIFRAALDELCERLSSSNQQHLSSLWRKELLESCRKNNSSLEKVERDIKSLQNATYDSMEIHLRINRLEQALRQEIEIPGATGGNLVLGQSQVEILRAFSRSHSLALYKPSDSTQSRDSQNICEPATSQSVLVEWVFVSQMGESESEYERVQKVLALAGLLSCPKPRGFRVLRCAGFIPPDPQARTNEYGFVYVFPTSSSSPPTPLRHLLSGAERQAVPTLENKFSIAKALSSSIFELHCCGWLHRNISSENVIFFVHANGEKAKTTGVAAATPDMDDPYIIGFHHSRPDGHVYCSDIRSAEDVNPDAVFYQHPNYSDNTNTRFEKTHDCYGLGMVLLEIAFWRSCDNMWREEKKRNPTMDRRAFKDRLVKRFVPRLAAVMGTAYMEAVLACFSAKPPRNESGGSGNAFSGDQDSQFFRKVVQKLDACFVG
ncbi:hypothetical protein QBC44DRAFT_389886 [Cladorrhinum sp. PSN332]|nr:hypothetical protein QBC44DRAFT_389886 [Cladorrhinum sp. PSN332]